jgi:hypothetical protein
VLSGFSGLKGGTNFSSYFDPDLQVTAVQGKRWKYNFRSELSRTFLE